MGMEMGSITMGGHQHFVPRPRLRRELQSDLMGMLVGDILFRREGLHILVEADTLILVPCGFGSLKLCDGVQTITVDSADPADACFLIPCLLFLHAVFHDPLHIAGPLSGYLDIGDSRQSITPADVPDFLVDGPLQIDDFTEVVGSKNAGVDLGGDLIQIVADAL